MLTDGAGGATAASAVLELVHRALESESAAGTQFTSFTDTKVHILPLNAGASCAAERVSCRYPLYLLNWYKSTNSDGGALGGAARAAYPSEALSY
jgi:hypothetical protein